MGTQQEHVLDKHTNEETKQNKNADVVVVEKHIYVFPTAQETSKAEAQFGGWPALRRETLSNSKQMAALRGVR